MEQEVDEKESQPNLFGDEAQLEEEKAGGTVKVASIKQRNFQDDSDQEIEEINEDDPTG